MKFTSAFAILICASVAHASTVANVLTDIAKINTAVTSLGSQVNAFNGNIGAALGIHSDVGPIVTNINTATTDAKNIASLPVSLADGTSIINAVTTLKPVIVTALNNIVAKHAAFADIPVPGVPALVASDLNNLNTATQAFEAALIAKSPPALLASATSLRNDINAAFATAISAFSQGEVRHIQEQ